MDSPTRRRSSKDEMQFAMEGGEEREDLSKGHAAKTDFKTMLCSPKGAGCLVSGIAAFFVLPRIGSFAVSMFTMAERSIDSSSWIHMFGFILVSMLFHIPFPMPVVMQAWSVSIGCFFKWWGFFMLAVSFSCGVPMSFSIGRHVAHKHGRALEEQLEDFMPTGVAYMRSLRKAAKKQPVRLSFLLMWAPLPTSLCPFMVGFLLPEKDLSVEDFLTGAVPSKVLHFACQVMIGIQAGSFTKAMAAHDGAKHSGDDAAEGSDWSGVVAIGSTILSVLLIGYMMVTIHHELDGFKKEQEHEDSMPWYGKDNCFSKQVSPSSQKNKSQ